MYYHSRELKYVEYGKVYPVWTPNKVLDNNYRWLGQFCGYSPQIWLSKANTYITGFKNKKNKYNKDDILFGFDIIKGFPVSYEPWEYSLNALVKDYDAIPSTECLNTDMMCYIDTLKSYYEEGEELEDPYMESYENLLKYLFIEKDQVVVPSLNLKSAKEIICRNERQKKSLRKMGFIEDRIKIKNIRRK